MQQFAIPNRKAFEDELRKRMKEKWMHLIWWNNCADFADKLLLAGGVPAAEINPAMIHRFHDHTHYPLKSVLTAPHISLRHDLHQTLQHITTLYFYPVASPDRIEQLTSDIKDANAVILLGHDTKKTAYFMMNGRLLQKQSIAISFSASLTNRLNAAERDNEGKIKDNDITQKIVSRLHAKQHYAPIKESFFQSATAAGMPETKARHYSKCRAKHGMSHEDARFEADPGVMTFLMTHKTTLYFFSLFNPLIALATSAIIALDESNWNRQVFSKFFPYKKSDEPAKKADLTIEEKVLACTRQF